MGDDWFRNDEWSEPIAQRFEEKLRRARHKEQYLRIQAGMLARTHPKIALALLDRYFALPDQIDQAQAHVDRAIALLELGRLDAAIESYEAALAREAAFPNVQTQAYLELPYLIATRGVENRYVEATSLLEQYKARLTFPVEHFRWHVAYALISAASGDNSKAKVHSQLALEAAARDHSGFRYHPTVGLVSDEYDDVVQKLRGLL